MKLISGLAVIACTGIFAGSKTAPTTRETIPVNDTNFVATGNPIITHKFTADPAALVYKGILNEIAGNSNTNHQSIIEFKGRSYFIYHNGALVPDAGSFHRSVCIDYLYYRPDGTINRIVMTSEGVGNADKPKKGLFSR